MKMSLPRFHRLSVWLSVTVLLGLAVVYATWAWTDTLTDLGGDSATYLTISRLYSPYHQMSAATAALKNGIFSPPLFPFLLSLVDGGYHFLAAHLLVAFFALASTAALHFWLTRENVPAWAAMLISLLFALLPATMQTALNIWSEFPCLFFSMVAIALLAPLKRGESLPQSTWITVAIMVACACLTRVAALPLLGAFLLALLILRPRRTIGIGVLATLPFVAWATYSALLERGASAYTHVLIDNYTEHSLARFILQFHIEYDAVIREWKMAWLHFSSSDELHALVGGFLALCVAGCLYRLTRLRFDGIYALLYTIELFLWPYPGEAGRYSFMLYPILITNGFLLLTALPDKIARPMGRPYLLGLGTGVMILCALPAIGYNADSFFTPLPTEVDDAHHTQAWYAVGHSQALVDAEFKFRLLHHLAEIDSIVPPGDCVFAIKPSLVILISDRMSFGPPDSSRTDAQFNTEITKCHYAYVISSTSTGYRAMYYPKDRLGNRAKILSRFNDDSGDMDGALLKIEP